jgi:hypothetical protein
MQKYNEYAETLAASPCSAAQFRQAVEAIYGKEIKDMRESFVSQLNYLFYNGKGNEGKTMYDALNSVTEWNDHYSRKTKDARVNYSQFGAGANSSRRAMQVLLELAEV